jgi:GGDEF domain-containing protein
MRWPRRLGFEASQKTLEESRWALRSELRDFSEIAGEFFREVPTRAQVINSLVMRASELLRERTDTYHALVDSLAERLEAGADLDDPVEFRKMLRQQASGLRYRSEAINREVSQLLNKISEEASHFQQRLENPEYLAITDELTRLPSRAGALRQVRSLLESGRQFCVLVFQIKDLAAVPSDQTDPVVLRLSQRLVELVRPTDIACRWAPDSFFVIFLCGKDEAEPRALQISNGLTDSFFAVKDGRKQRIKLEVGCVLTEPELDADFDSVVQQLSGK